MKKFLLLGLAGLFSALGLNAVSAQSLYFATSGQVSDLACPPRNVPPKPPTRKPGTPAEVMEPPSIAEISELPPPTSDEGNRRSANLVQSRRVMNHPLSIGIWGDSHLAAHFFGDELIRLTGLPREQVLPGFIPATMGRPGVRLPIRKYCQSAGWTYKLAYLSKEPGARFPQNLALTQTSDPNSYLWVDFRLGDQVVALRGVDIALQAPSRHTVIGVRVDDAEEQLVEVATGGPSLIEVHADKGLSQLRIRLVEGELNLEGFTPLYQGPPPVLRMDTLAIPGSMAKGWAMVDTDYVQQRLGDFQYDVIVMEYGTNEGNVKPFSASNYESDLRATLTNLRKVFPDSQCILIGPTDRGILVQRPAGRKHARKIPAPDLLTYARIHQTIGDIQQSVGKAFNCGFWSWQNAMGGQGAAYRWFYNTPRMMANDLIHLTIPGYQLSARKFADSTGFQNWVSGKAPR